MLLRCNGITNLASRIRPISSTHRFHFSVGFKGQSIRQHGYYAQLLQNPTKIASLRDAMALHANLVTRGSFGKEDLVFVHNNLLAKYASIGETHMARKLFDQMTHKNVVSHNTMVSCYGRDGLLDEASGLFSEMRKCGFKPTQFTLGGLLSCDVLDVYEGMQLQALIEKSGLLFVDAYTGTSLLGMYRRCRCLDEAVRMFLFMPKKSLVTWNSMISIFRQMGCIKDCIFMLSELMRTPLGISEITFVNVLSGFDEADLLLGEQIHGLVVKYGFDRHASVSNCLINMYSRSGATFLAGKMFEDIPDKDIVTWNTLIGAMGNSNQPIEAFDIFLKMLMTGLSPDETTLVSVLNSCSRLNIYSYGEYIHAKMIKKRFDSGACGGSALVSFYGKCDKAREAHTCFDGITWKNTVSWNSLMQAYTNGDSLLSVRLFNDMIHSGYYPNGMSFSIAIKSSPKLELQQLHSLAIKVGYHENPYVLSSLISSYARNGPLTNALIFVESASSKLPAVSSNVIAWIYNQTGQYEKTQELYATVENPDSISWNILIAACSRNGDYRETFELFNHMRRSQAHPDSYTYVSLFSVCTKLCDLALGSSLHGLIEKSNTNLCDTFVCNVMIDMYGKCGAIESSVKVFNNMAEKNVISWTALLSALGQHGHAYEALERFGEMEASGILPDKVAFFAVLSACRHIGLAKQGMHLFNQMKMKYNIEPDIDHYAVVVDLLTRYGHVKEAERLIQGMPGAPNALIWHSFFEGCKKRILSSPALAP